MSYPDPAVTVNPLLTRYRECEAMIVRAQTGEKIDEEAVLDEMEKLWWELTEPERTMLSHEGQELLGGKFYDRDPL